MVEGEGIDENVIEKEEEEGRGESNNQVGTRSAKPNKIKTLKNEVVEVSKEVQELKMEIGLMKTEVKSDLGNMMNFLKII